MSNRIFLILAIFVSSCSKKKISPDIENSNDFDAIKRLETEWLEAEFKMDTAKIARMMDHRFMGISGATLSTKQEELNGIFGNIRQRQKEEHFVDSFDLKDFQIKFYNSTAIVTFICVSKGKSKKYSI